MKVYQLSKDTIKSKKKNRYSGDIKNPLSAFREEISVKNKVLIEETTLFSNPIKWEKSNSNSNTAYSTRIPLEATGFALNQSKICSH